MQSQTKEYMSAKELCTKLDITTQTLWRWNGDPEVNMPKALKIKGKRFYPIAEVQTWLEQARG
tara:strand:+ start:1659 stop:1847 length:189 start_codon:yes stop_codon:yes gene_type:complete